jgi:ectoine hydroxylase-related dioxygenase (phytanoyl-CoA dioxygenase family)
MPLSADEALARLDRDGFVILESLLGPAEVRELVAALAPLEAARPPGRNEFEGLRSTRVYSLAGKGEPFLRLAEHPRVVEILDRALLPNWLLSTFQSIRLHPGESAQPWHADDGFYLIPRPRARLAVSAIWALEDFTAENGATEVFPGSHRWPDDRPPEGGRGAVPALMPAGSVVLFDGALWHRGGENRSRGTRLAVSPQYCQPWLRPQESQLLIVPPEAAARCSPRARSMLGYSIHPPFIGQVDGMHPLRLVDPGYRSNGRANQTEASITADRMLVPGQG